MGSHGFAATSYSEAPSIRLFAHPLPTSGPIEVSDDHHVCTRVNGDAESAGLRIRAAIAHWYALNDCAPDVNADFQGRWVGGLPRSHF